MRIVGFVLVLLGALVLGIEGLALVMDVNGGAVTIPPVVGGIVLVSGLLLLATPNRPSES